MHTACIKVCQMIMQAIKSLAKGKPDAILIDGNRVPCELQCPTSESVVKGDSKCISVAAASILAKVLC